MLGQSTMLDIPTQAQLILNTILLQDAQLRAAGLSAESRMDAMAPGLEALIGKFQDDLLESQREAGVALASALNRLGGK